MADRVARFVLGVPQVAPSLLHHYLHMVPPHTLAAASTTLLGTNNIGSGSLTTSQGVNNSPAPTPTIPLVGYAQNLVFSVASGFVPSSDLISQLASLELLVMREVDSSAVSAPSGTYPSKVSVINAHVTFHASLQGIQFYFSEYPVLSFMLIAVIWGGFIGFGCLAAAGGAAALFYNSTHAEDAVLRPTHTKRTYSDDEDYRPHQSPTHQSYNRGGGGMGSQYASGYVAPSRRNQPQPPSPPSTSTNTNDEESSHTGSTSDTTDCNESTTPATTTNNSTPARGSAADLHGMVPGTNRVWTPRPVRSRGGSRREQHVGGEGVTSPNNQEARWVDVTSHRLGSEEGWARRSEEPRRDDDAPTAAASSSSYPLRSAATGNFGGGSPQTKVSSPPHNH